MILSFIRSVNSLNILAFFVFFSSILNFNIVHSQEIYRPKDSSAAKLAEIASGQFMMVGLIEGRLSEFEIQFLKKIKPGGIILFKRNISSLNQVSKLNTRLQEISYAYSELPLFISVDQEGGRVARIDTFPKMPSPLALGFTNDPGLVEAVSYETGKLIRSVGINMNLAPVLDILNRQQFSFIGDRSFGYEPNSVSNLGSAFARGQLRAGVIPTSKHFPGFGSMTKDPHFEAVEYQKLLQSELEPFKNFSSIFPSAIMMSHASYPSLDPENTPALFSKRIMRDLLRTDWKYQGLILTDDLQMKGSKSHHNIGRQAVRSLKSGADIIMVTWGRKTQLIVKQAITEAIVSGELTKDEVEEKLQRIRNIKSFVSKNLSADRNLASVFDSKKMSELDDRILKMNLQKSVQSLSLSRAKNVAVLSADTHFSKHISKSMNQSVQSVFPEKLSSSLLSKLSGTDVIIVPAENRRTLWYAANFPREFRRKMLIINMASPSHFNKREFLAVIDLFHKHENTAKALGELLKSTQVF